MSAQVLKKVGLHSALAVAVASAALTGCGSSSSEGGGGGHIISLNGGTGGAGASSYGGSGSYFELYKRTGGGDTKVMSSGAANPAFTAATFTPYLGTNPAVVAANATPDLYASCGATVVTATGNLYTVVNDSRLFISNGDAVGCDASEVATGLQVKAGATLTLPINYTAWTSWAYLNLANDIENRGAITVADFNATTRGSIDLQGSSYLGVGTMDASGTASVPNAGSIYMWMNYSMINSGAVSANGADSSTANAGAAGYIDLESDRYTQNTAALTAHGGNSTFAGGNGGNGDYIELYGSTGPVRNSGQIDDRGGTSASGTGGGAGDVYLDGYLGGTYNSGKIMAYGANSTVGNGGWGGYIEFYGYAGDIRNGADILAYGGDTTDTAGSGGSGNELYIYGTDSCVACEGPDTPMGDVAWSGNIDLHGGNAVASGTGSGGSAGNVYADIDSTGYTVGSDLAFVGYSEVHTYGGDGNYGGNGDEYDLYDYDGYVNGYQNAPAPAGNVISQVKVDAHGGNAIVTGAAANAGGGRGGYIDLETDYYNTAQLTPNGAKVMHTGDINKAGGKNRNATSNSSGRSNGIWVWGSNGVTWNGNVIADGGSDIGAKGATTGYGGYVNWLEWWSEYGPVAYTGTLSANGGDGPYRGGSHSGIDSYAAKIVWSGNITANGGNADPTTTPGSIGGNGSWIEFKATDPASSTVSGTISVLGGTGATAGSKGTVAGTLACIGTSC